MLQNFVHAASNECLLRASASMLLRSANMQCQEDLRLPEDMKDEAPKDSLKRLFAVSNKLLRASKLKVVMNIKLL